MNSFRLTGLAYEPFALLFSLNDTELAKLDATRVTAQQSPGYPCRVSLQDAEIGEELLLLPYLHQPASSPYRASGPIYVRREAIQRVLEPGEIPAYVSRRLISIRAYDAAHMMLNAEVIEGSGIAAEIARQFADQRIAYIHLHNARQGCFSCLAERV
ncbi:MAG: DUF1203 domain-containing protein [Gammaproteobacteria bacterium]